MDLHAIAPAPRLAPVVSYGRYPTVVVLVCALIGNFLFTSGFDEQRCVELAALGLMTMILVVRAASGSVPMIPRTTGILLLVFFVLGLVSALAAYSLRHALYEWAIFFLLLILVFAIAAELATDASCLRSVLSGVGIACGLYSLRVIIMYIAALASGFQMDMHSLAVGFGNARVLNHAQTPLLALLVSLCLQAPRGSGWRKTWFIVSAFWWALLFACEARASILALAAGCTVAFMLRRGQARQFLALMAWTTLAGLVMYVLLFLLLPPMVGMLPFGTPMNVLERTAANPSSNRNLLWGRALHLIATHPVLGIGPQHFAHFGADLSTGAHPHDWLLQIGVEWGLPALLCLLSIVFLGARALIRAGTRIPSGDTANQRMLVTLLVACTAMFVDGLFSGVLVMPQSQLAIALVLGMAAAWVRMHSTAENSAGVAQAPAMRLIVSTLAVAGLYSLLWALAPTLAAHARGDALSPAEAVHNTGSPWPRMWQAGYF